jgi:hypothetical protein
MVVARWVKQESGPLIHVPDMPEQTEPFQDHTLQHARRIREDDSIFGRKYRTIPVLEPPPCIGRFLDYWYSNLASNSDRDLLNPECEGYHREIVSSNCS